MSFNFSEDLLKLLDKMMDGRGELIREMVSELTEGKVTDFDYTKHMIVLSTEDVEKYSYVIQCLSVMVTVKTSPLIAKGTYIIGPMLQDLSYSPYLPKLT